MGKHSRYKSRKRSRERSPERSLDSDSSQGNEPSKAKYPRGESSRVQRRHSSSVFSRSPERSVTSSLEEKLNVFNLLIHSSTTQVNRQDVYLGEPNLSTLVQEARGADIHGDPSSEDKENSNPVVLSEGELESVLTCSYTLYIS